MSHDTENCVYAPVVGFHSNAPELFDGPYGGPAGQPDCDGGQFPEPATTRILPLLSSATWMGLIGITYGCVLHTPVTLA